MKQHYSLFWWLSWKVIKTVIIKCTSAATTAVITSMNRLQLLQVLLLLEIKAWVVIREAITVAAAATVAVQFNWTFIYTWNRKTLIQGRREKKKNILRVAMPLLSGMKLLSNISGTSNCWSSGTAYLIGARLLLKPVSRTWLINSRSLTKGWIKIVSIFKKKKIPRHVNRW